MGKSRVQLFQEMSPFVIIWKILPKRAQNAKNSTKFGFRFFWLNISFEFILNCLVPTLTNSNVQAYFLTLCALLDDCTFSPMCGKAFALHQNKLGDY